MVVSDIFSSYKLIKECILRATEPIAIFNADASILTEISFNATNLIINGSKNITLEDLTKQITRITVKLKYLQYLLMVKKNI